MSRYHTEILQVSLLLLLLLLLLLFREERRKRAAAAAAAAAPPAFPGPPGAADPYAALRAANPALAAMDPAAGEFGVGA